MLLKLEIKRIQRKGSYFYVGVMLYIAIFTLIPICAQHYWKNLIDLFSSKVLMSVIFTNILHLLNNVLLHGGMFLLYQLRIQCLQKYQIMKKPFPFDQPNNTEWVQLRNQTIQYVSINIFVVIPIFSAIDAYLGGVVFRFDLESFPNLFESFWQIQFFTIIQDFGFYWCHRMMHHPLIYSKVHQLHHEYNNSVSYAGHYSHPIEFFVTSLPFSLGFKILGDRVHYFTFLFWGFWRLLDSVDSHCGYEFPWNPLRVLPFSTSSEYHNYHHSHNSGNYGSFFTFWDYFMNTNSQFYQHFKIQ